MYLLPIQVCYVIGSIKTFITKSLSSQPFNADERLLVFALRASLLGMISAMRLDGKKDIKAVKSARSVLHTELKSCILPPLRGSNKGPKTNTHTHQIKNR